MLYKASRIFWSDLMSMSSNMHTDSFNSCTFYQAQVQGVVVELDPFRLDMFNALFGRKTGEQVYGPVLELVDVLLEVISGVSALPGPRRPRDVEYISLSWYRVCAGTCCHWLY